MDCFIKKKFMTPFIYKTVYASGLSEIRTFEQLIVRISDVFSTEQIVQPNRSYLSEIRTVRILDVDCMYSGMLKSERVLISDRSLWFGSNFCSNANMSEIQTILLGFRTKICV